MINFTVKLSTAVYIICLWTSVFAEFPRITQENTNLEIRGLKLPVCSKCVGCDDYEDPAAMFGRDYYMTTQRKEWSTSTAPCNCRCDDNVTKAKYRHSFNVLKRLVSEILDNVVMDAATKSVYLKLEVSREDYRVMQAFRYTEASDDLDRLTKVLPVLSKLATEATAHEETVFKRYFYTLVTGLSVLNDYRELMVVLLCALLAYALVHWWFFLSKSWFFVLWKGFILLFIISSFWKWVLLYKKAVAKNFSKQSKYFVEHGQTIPRECRPRDMSLWQTFTTWLSSKFSVMPSDCEEYFESVIVDPVWSVSPLDAVSETFWNLVFYPLQVFARYIGLFFRNLFQVLPVHLWTPVAASMILLFAFFLVMHYRYRIRILYCLLELLPTDHLRPLAVMPHDRERIQTIPSNQLHVECAKCRELVLIQESDEHVETRPANSRPTGTKPENKTEHMRTEVPPQPGPFGDSNTEQSID